MDGDLIRVLAPVLAVGFAVAAVLAVRSSRQAGERLRRSVPATGVVAAVDYNMSQQAFPDVAFATADGQQVVARPDSSSNLRGYQVGQQVGLRYDPQQPSWIVLDGQPGAAGASAVAGVVLALGAVLLAAVSVLLLT
jgi:hypothetical protein